MEKQDFRKTKGRAPGVHTQTEGAFVGIDQFSHYLRHCEYAAIDVQVDRQQALTALPDHDTAFALTGHEISLLCVCWDSYSDAGTKSYIYGPIIGDAAQLVPEMIEFVTFHLFIDEEGDFGLLPLHENGSLWHADLRFALEVAKQQPVTLLTCGSEPICSIAPADVKIDTNVARSVFDRVLREAFDGLVVTSLEHPFVSIHLTDEQRSRGVL